MLAIGQLVLGLALLLGGAELFTQQASRAARRLRITTLAVGLLFAGAEPEELFTAAIAAAKGAPGIALGDVVGTNVTIIALALGLAAMILPVKAERGSLRHGVLTLLAALPATAFLAWGQVPRWAGAILVPLYFLYIGYIVLRERIPVEMEGLELDEVLENPGHRLSQGGLLSVVLVVLALAVMGGGGNFTVDGARGLAQWLGVGEGVVGLTVVALATSAEMLFLAVVPTLRGHPELGIGGILGSYGYNATLTLGVAALVAPLAAANGTLLAGTVMMAGALVLLLPMLRRGWLTRPHGLVLVAFYGVYLALVSLLAR